VSRLPLYHTPNVGHPRFNPVLGFLSVSTEPIYGSDTVEAGGFNPVLGFLSVSTGPLAAHKELPDGVSIPCWVF